MDKAVNLLQNRLQTEQLFLMALYESRLFIRSCPIWDSYRDNAVETVVQIQEEIKIISKEQKNGITNIVNHTRCR